MLTTCASRTEHGRPYLGRGLTARAACLGALLTQRPRMDACFWTSRLRGACHRSLSCVLCCVVGWGGRGGGVYGTRAHASSNRNARARYTHTTIATLAEPC